MKTEYGSITLVLVLLGGLLAGCGTAATAADAGASAAAAERIAVAESASNEARTGSVLNEDYGGALPVSSQLALGTFQLAGTGNEVTAEQARTLLPLWQVVESGALQSESETGAVLRQIEGAMTAEQLAAIAAMELTLEDMGSWAEAQGVSLAGPGGDARGAALPEGMTEEQMEKMRAAREAGGEAGFGPPEGMSQEDRAAMRATAEANGMAMPNGAGGMGGGQLAALTGPLVELLSELVAG